MSHLKLSRLNLCRIPHIWKRPLKISTGRFFSENLECRFFNHPVVVCIRSFRNPQSAEISRSNWTHSVIDYFTNNTFVDFPSKHITSRATNIEKATSITKAEILNLLTTPQSLRSPSWFRTPTKSTKFYTNQESTVARSTVMSSGLPPEKHNNTIDLWLAPRTKFLMLSLKV